MEAGAAGAPRKRGGLAFLVRRAPSDIGGGRGACFSAEPPPCFPQVLSASDGVFGASV